MRSKYIFLPLIVSGVLAAAACSNNAADSNSNVSNVSTLDANANSMVTPTPAVAVVTPPAVDVETVTSPSGVKTETRTFKDNGRITKVVVTTKPSGEKSAKVYTHSGESRDLPENKVAGALSDTGDAIADAAGFVADKSKEGYHAAKEGTGKVVDKTAEGAKTVGEETADTSKKVANKTVDVSKTVGEKTAEGAKKTGKAIKNAVTP